jgi:hypothetical protein
MYWPYSRTIKAHIKEANNNLKPHHPTTNINHSYTTPSSATMNVETESYLWMQGVQIEDTRDVGSVQNINKRVVCSVLTSLVLLASWCTR